MKIWIFNHYATNMFFEGAGRHHSFAKYLTRMGYEVTIFCANVVHNREDIININDNSLFCDKEGQDGVNYTFIKTRPYTGNGLERIKNMFDYLINVKKVAKKKIQEGIGPDIIIASSVHPLALVAGIQVGGKNNIPCICEVRDLWPETFVEFGMIKRKSLIAKILYRGERWIYEKADQLIFTIPGGADYIKDKHWEDYVDLSKVHYINNGVDLEVFNFNKETYKIEDADLMNNDFFKVVYAGSIRAANQVEVFVEIAQYYKEKGVDDIKFILYGDGDQRDKIELKCKEMQLENIIFKGRVDNKYIAHILSCGDLNIVTDKKNNLGKYGVSWNKLFEYMASGKPTVANYDMGNYNLIEEYDIGIAKEFDTIVDFANAIIDIKKLSEEKYNQLCKNARKSAQEYQYANLTKKLDNVIKLAFNL